MICRQLGQPRWHRAESLSALYRNARVPTTCPPGLPSRVFICGLPRYRLFISRRYRRWVKHIEIHLLFTNPCRYCWGNIREFLFIWQKADRQRGTALKSPIPRYFATAKMPGSSLTAMVNRMSATRCWLHRASFGRDSLFSFLTWRAGRGADAFVDVTPDKSLLHNIQSDILELENRAVAGVNIEEFSVAITNARLIHWIAVSPSTFAIARSVKLKFYTIACWRCWRKPRHLLRATSS
ncbi:exodeoxyribonuclease V subunit gamma [Shigella sonnei]